jgi:hypothetical protein
MFKIIKSDEKEKIKGPLCGPSKVNFISFLAS